MVPIKEPIKPPRVLTKNPDFLMIVSLFFSSSSSKSGEPTTFKR